MTDSEQEGPSSGHLGGPDADPVPDISGRKGPTEATPMQVFASGASAYSAGRLDEAATAFQQAIDSMHPDIAPLAAIKLQSMREH